MSVHGGFNGATTQESWKGHHQGWYTTRCPRFNGATTQESWKSSVLNRPATSAVLQWGHDAGVVEEMLRPVVVRPSAASMGPRRRSRGRDQPAGPAGPAARFNGATTQESWKRWRQTSPALVTSQCFNGATTQESWKRNSTDRAPLKRFNGATTQESWKRRPSGARIRPRQLGFNGATTQESWKARGTSWPGKWLQWGHDDGVVEDAIDRNGSRT